ncbi:MAG: 30S ribosomal protein S20 [Dehalococcoidia bacterium]
MPHPASAKKRHRQSETRRVRNQARRTEARTVVRQAREAIASGDGDAATAAVRQAVSVLDRTARKGVLHPNNVARRKSRLMRKLNAGADAPAEAPKRRSRAKKSGDER